MTALLMCLIAQSDPGDEKYWSDHSVVYAQVEKVTQLTAPEYTISLRPQATISGRFDPCAEPMIDALFVIGPYNSYLQTLPRPGSMVIALIGERYNPPPRQQLELKGGKYAISTDELPFFPKKRVSASGLTENPQRLVPFEGIFEVKDFGDPRIAEVRAEIQKLRGKAASGRGSSK